MRTSGKSDAQGSTFDGLSGRVKDIASEALDITKQLKQLEELPESETGISRQELKRLDDMLKQFWNMDENLRELVNLPEEGFDLLTAAGYIRQDEWHTLFPKMKEKQKEAKALRKQGFEEVTRLLISGERELDENLEREGQDPEEFARNVHSFLDAVQHEYKKGKWKNVFMGDLLRDRSMKPKTYKDIQTSVTTSISAPSRSKSEEWLYRRSERIMYVLQDSYLQGDFAYVFNSLKEKNLLSDIASYTDPVISIEGVAHVQQVYESLARAPVDMKVEFIWSVASESEPPDRSIHVEYSMHADNASDNDRDVVSSLMSADYYINAEGLVEAIDVQSLEESHIDFLEIYRHFIQKEV